MTINTEDADLAMLTEAERAALAEPDDEDTTATQGELEDQAKAAAGTTTTTTEGNDDDEDDTGAGDGAAAAAGDDGAAAANADDGKAGAPAGDEPGAAPSAPAQQAPILVAKAPEDAEQKLADIASKKSDLDTKFDDGDITSAEYRREMDALNKQEREIELAQSKAEIAADMERQRLQNQWNADCDAFFGKHKDTYFGDANKEAFDHLNETIKAFARMPRYANLSGPEMLDKAHRHVMADRGTPVAEPKPAAKADPKPQPKKPTLPPDLGSMPAATGNDPGEGRWANLDRLAETNTLAFEAALAKLSDADRDAYLAAN